MYSYHEILQIVKSWPAAVQRRFIEELMETLPLESRTELSPAWKAEIRRRSALIDEGKMKFYTWDEVCEQIHLEEGSDD